MTSWVDCWYETLQKETALNPERSKAQPTSKPFRNPEAVIMMIHNLYDMLILPVCFTPRRTVAKR